MLQQRTPYLSSQRCGCRSNCEHVPSLSSSYLYTFDFTGVDLTTYASLTDKQIKRLRDELLKEYGYAPFDESEAEKILGTGKQYRIEQQ